MIHSFLLIGQSNMAGRGRISEAVPVNTEHLFVLRNGRWQPLYRPVNGDRGFSGVCLAESFAERYAAEHGVDVGLIPCADGGTSLNQWQVGGLLYDHAVMQARLAQRTSTIAGVLWHQGEADCAPRLAQTYAERVEVILNSMRYDLQLEDVPFLLGGLGDFLTEFQRLHDSESLGNYPAVNEQLRRAAQEMPMTGFVSAEGLTSNPDFLHFNAASLHEFGLRYYEVFRTLEDPDKVFTEKFAPDDAVCTAMESL